MQMKQVCIQPKSDWNSKKYFECRMLEENRIPKILPVVKVEQRSLCFDITDRISLIQYMENRALVQEDVKKILMDLDDAFYVLQKYLLDEKDLIVDVEHIYTGKDGLELAFCYMPDYQGEIEREISKLLSQILGRIDHNDKEAVVLGYSLYQESLKEGYVMGDLLELLQRQKKEMPKNQREMPKEMVKPKEDLPKEQEKEPDKPSAKKFKMSDLFKKKQKTVAKEEIQESKEWEEVFEKAGERKEEEGYEHTTLLSDLPREGAILKRMDGSEDDIFVSYTPFTIGKQDRVCDYILDVEGVSRLHAKVDREEDGHYYIVDLHSLNGTYVKGKRMEPEQKVVLERGDEVEIAGKKFLFTL